MHPKEIADISTINTSHNSSEPGNIIELSIVMPCLNEAETLGTCIRKAKKYLLKSNIRGEIIVGDNGSTDGSLKIALDEGVRVINISQKGYGAALTGAIAEAKGTYVIMGDSDASYDFEELGLFMDKLREGYDVVIGNRFKGEIKPHAMPFLNQYLGNPVLSLVGRIVINSPVRDFHCGLRGARRAAIMNICLSTPGMEFASEMIVKAAYCNLKMTEVPTILWKDGRSRPSHLKPWLDGWRHLRFLLFYTRKNYAAEVAKAKSQHPEKNVVLEVPPLRKVS